jgi:hypothetical protein
MLVPSRPAQSARADGSGIARASGIVGLCALGLFFLAPLVFLAAELLESQVLFYVGCIGAAALSFVAGLIAVALAVYARLRGPWAIVGLATGIVSALFSLLGSVGLLVLISG